MFLALFLLQINAIFIMRHNYYLIIALSFVLWSCGDSKTSQEGSLITNDTLGKETKVGKEELVANKSAIALWKSGLRDHPHKGDSKWVSGVVFGEMLEIIGDTTYTEGGKEKTFLNLKLSDGKTGWDNAYLYAIDAEQGVVTSTLQLYDRPDILAMASKSLDLGELVAVYNDGQDGWRQISGYQKSKKGWVNVSDGLSTRPLDLKLAVLLKKIEESKDNASKMALVNQILNDTDNDTSVFYDVIEQKYAPKTTTEVDSVLLEMDADDSGLTE